MRSGSTRSIAHGRTHHAPTCCPFESGCVALRSQGRTFKRSQSAFSKMFTDKQKQLIAIRNQLLALMDAEELDMYPVIPHLEDLIDDLQPMAQ